MRKPLLLVALAATAAVSPAAQFITGPDSGFNAFIHIYDGTTGAFADGYEAYSGFTGGVRVASGDVNNDGVADIVTGAGAGSGGHVKVFDGQSGSQLQSFFAFDGFSGGVHVATGDVNGDGFADVIAGAGAGAAGGHVKVFDGQTQALIQSFFSFGVGFTGGVTVASGDVDGDGFADIVTGAGAGAAGGHVKVFSGQTGAEIRNFFAFDTAFSGGVYVGAGDLDGDSTAEVVVGAGEGSPGGHVKVFGGRDASQLHSFFAYNTSFAGGVRVAAGDVDGDGFAEIVTGSGPGAPGTVKVFDNEINLMHSLLPYDASFTGGVYVAAPAQAVPEPATLAVLAGGALALLRKRKKSQLR